MAATLAVTLLTHTPEPDRAVAAAGRLCYAPVSAAELTEQMTDGDVARLVRGLVASGHHSALEHATFTFAVDGVSRACTHQLVRHRVASYNQQSQRYVNFSHTDSFVVPPSVAANAAAELVFLRAMDQAREAYDQLVELGLAEGRSRESVQEDARFVLPNAAPTNFHVMVNFAEMLHICDLRLCVRAQWEIRRMVAMMRAEIKHVLPEIAVFLQPKCGENRMGYCDESLDEWQKCPLGKVRPHKSSLFDLYERYGSRKAQALGEAEFRAVEEKEQL